MDYTKYNEDILYGAYKKLQKKAQTCHIEELDRHYTLSRMATEIMSCLIEKRREYWRFVARELCR